MFGNLMTVLLFTDYFLEEYALGGSLSKTEHINYIGAETRINIFDSLFILYFRRSKTENHTYFIFIAACRVW